jgi:hypothetical protein
MLLMAYSTLFLTCVAFMRAEWRGWASMTLLGLGREPIMAIDSVKDSKVSLEGSPESRTREIACDELAKCIDVVDALAQVVRCSLKAFEVEHSLLAVHLAFVFLSKTLELGGEFVVDRSDEFGNLGVDGEEMS